MVLPLFLILKILRYTFFRMLRSKIRFFYKKLFTYYGKIVFYCKVYSVRFGLIEPIFIYQMGKVGSTSIRNSLQQSGFSYRTFHVHFLNMKDLKEHERLYPPCKHRTSSIILAKNLESRNVSKKIKIITSTREPVSRHISSIFQVPQIHGLEIPTNATEIEIARFTKSITDQLGLPWVYSYPYNWFNSEIKKVFGIDIYEFPFDKNNGFQIYKKDNVEILLFRLEDLYRHTEMLTDFIGSQKKIPLLKANQRNEMKDSDLYSIVNSRIKLEDELLEKIYSSDYVKHFYDKKMTDIFKEKWSK
jgi:hypothetical protein